ncbi:MAG: tyrosine--tRNA ligase [Actinobacteria bacterium]|nr:MAG: tyrosine--tRNA ligase [Actinomycetota bacterium]
MAIHGRSPAETAAWLARNAVESLPAGELERKLEAASAAGRPLRVKLGIDPTAPDIHLGHTVVLNKLREFQDLGHLVVLIIGDFTARVGDPSGRSSTRPVLTADEIEANARTFQEQAFTVLAREPQRLEVRRNGEWLDMPMERFLALAGTATVAQLLERDDFARRMEKGQPISLLEVLYPLMQGYDSVAVAADVELGGTDQKFNLLLARDVQRSHGQPEQAILTMPILVGTDGHEKMSKSLGNHIGVTDSPEDIYGKTLSVPDECLADYYSLLVGQEPPKVGPRDAKRALARTLVARFYDASAAQAAERHFDRLFVERKAPEDVPEASFEAAEGEVHLPGLIADVFGMSRSEARRVLEQGGVRLGDEILSTAEQDLAAERLDGQVLRVGKRRFARLKRI